MTIDFTYVMCDKCHGMGKIKFDDCDACNGTGNIYNKGGIENGRTYTTRTRCK
jgi:DnaJ-class molecular chaperone